MATTMSPSLLGWRRSSSLVAVAPRGLSFRGASDVPPGAGMIRSSHPRWALRSSSGALENMPGGLPERLGFLVGLGAVAGTAMAFPEHVNAAEVASNWDAWSAVVASEPKNALSLPTWVIHVASVAECMALPCRVLESVFGSDSGEVQSSGLFRETELTNALSLPTWFIHVASVVEWVTAMALVWRYGDTPGNSTWKGLSWGMVPLLGGAMCACTWHFFYNAQSLEILVVIQAALTVIGNFTMWVAAFRIYQASQKQSKAP